MSSHVISLDVQASGRLMTPLEVMKHVLAENWDGERLAYALPRGLMLVGIYSPVSSVALI